MQIGVIGPGRMGASMVQRLFSSRGEADFAGRLLSAIRFGFGGHLAKPPSAKVG